jgi:hypothetical protein
MATRSALAGYWSEGQLERSGPLAQLAIKPGGKLNGIQREVTIAVSFNRRSSS